MIIIVTGSVASGKTAAARKIAKQKKLRYIDVNKLIKDNKLYSYYNKKDRSYVVDVKKLNKFLVKLIKKEDNLVLDSHLSHYLPGKYVDLCIVTKCRVKEMKRRMEKRKYPAEKIRNNMECEILDVCLVEALENRHKVKIIRTSR